MNHTQNNSSRDQWGSKLGFILAAAGSAVGLGNLWKFPYMAGKNGGGAFVIVYVSMLFLVGFGLMIAEIALGRKTQLSPIGAYRKIKEKWAWVGGLGIAAAFLILSYYGVIGGWVINYFIKALTGSFNVSDPGVLAETFSSFTSSTGLPIFYQALFMIFTLVIVLGGIGKGIEKASTIMMPTLFILLIILAGRSLTLNGAADGLKYLLVPDFTQITGEVILSAMGQVFFSLSLGMGALLTYGSYLDKKTDIPKSSTWILFLDTAVAILAGIVILPAVFTYGFDVSVGPGLMFITLPAVFSQMPLGGLFGTLFFLLVFFAAITSSISLLEVVVSYAVDEWNMPRKTSTFVVAFIIFLVGIPTSLSLGVWSGVSIFGMNIFDLYSYITDNILLTGGGFMLSIFVGWIWGTDNALKEITNDGTLNFAFAKPWAFIVKYLAPIIIAVIFIRSILG